MVGNWAKYYTPQHIAEEIVDKIPKEFYPKNVIDICAGSGNLLSAAEKRWGKANYISVDISDNNVLTSNYNFYQLDALDFISLNKLVKFKDGKRLVLANPPFGSISSSKNKIINNDPLEHYLSEFQQLNRAEASMLISNLTLLRKDDVFGALLPENIFSSEKFCSFRNFFLSLFDICFIGTSNQYFSGSEVKTRQFIGIYKGGRVEISDRFKRIENKREIVKIYRGIDNSKLSNVGDFNDIKNYSEVLHFNNPEGLIISKKYIHNSKLNTTEIVQPNDLIIIRVGRNSGRIVKPNEYHIGKLVSDHLFIIKSIPKKLSKKQLIKAEQCLLNSKKGLTASYISKADVYNTLKNII
jgi:methylase of polypeptide subunit release factors